MASNTIQPLSQRWPRVLLQFAIPALVAGLVARKGHAVPASLIGGIAVFALLSGLCLPSLFARWERLGQAIGKGVAAALTWVCLVPVFYLVFVPGRLVLLVARKDPMCRRFPTREATYWVPRAPVGGAETYRRQY